MLCIGLASLERSDYLLWLIKRYLVWHYFLSDSAVCQPAITGVFFAANIYGWYAWSRQTSQNEVKLKFAGYHCRRR
ncbi:hypothetical protein ACLB1Q_11390 [Escherichia coli]